MIVNADFSIKAVVNTQNIHWQPSPVPGVERKYLDRVGGEVAIASTVVKYAANSSFTRHTHDGGEEILVLDGVFSDETGNYPAGSYLRNPPNSSHAPFSKQGCTLFVKLRQFHPEDVQTVRINTNDTPWYLGMVPGLSVMPLHEFNGVGTALVKWSPNTIFNTHIHPGGEEIFVIKGIFYDEHGSYPQGTWIRSPRYSKHTPFTKSDETIIYVKTGHLDYPMQQQD